MLLAGTGSLTTGIAGNVYVGTVSPAALTIQDSASLTTQELDVNFESTAAGASTLTITGGSLHVTGPTYVGRAQMNTGPGTTNGAVYQSGGTATLSGTAIVGNAGTALSLYSINGGVLNASGGLLIGGNNGQGVRNGKHPRLGRGENFRAAPGFKSDKILRWPPAEA